MGYTILDIHTSAVMIIPSAASSFFRLNVDICTDTITFYSFNHFGDPDFYTSFVIVLLVKTRFYGMLEIFLQFTVMYCIIIQTVSEKLGSNKLIIRNPGVCELITSGIDGAV